MKFYLAGPVGYGPDGVLWKQNIKLFLRSRNHEVYDPIENDGNYSRVKEMNEMKYNPKKYHAEIKAIMQEIFQEDCKFIGDCDYLICYFTGRAYGTISEQGIAYYLSTFLRKNIRTLCIIAQDFHPDEWVLCCSDEIFFSIEECLTFLREKIE